MRPLLIFMGATRAVLSIAPVALVLSILGCSSSPKHEGDHWEYGPYLAQEVSISNMPMCSFIEMVNYLGSNPLHTTKWRLELRDVVPEITCIYGKIFGFTESYIRLNARIAIDHARELSSSSSYNGTRDGYGYVNVRISGGYVLEAVNSVMEEHRLFLIQAEDSLFVSRLPNQLSAAYISGWHVDTQKTLIALDKLLESERKRHLRIERDLFTISSSGILQYRDSLVFIAAPWLVERYWYECVIPNQRHDRIGQIPTVKDLFKDMQARDPSIKDYRDEVIQIIMRNERTLGDEKFWYSQLNKKKRGASKALGSLRKRQLKSAKSRSVGVSP